MNRPTLIAVVLGIVTVATALYSFTAFPRHDPAAAQPGAEGQMAAAPIPADAWPICSSMGSIGDNADWAPLDPDFAAGKKALASGDWAGAIDALTRAGLRDARNADIQNHLGYAHRRLRQLDQAIGHYRQALVLNPRHRSAHEHLGEAYLALGDLANAEGQLAALQRICLLPCDEYDDLRQAIAEYNKLASR